MSNTFAIKIKLILIVIFLIVTFNQVFCQATSYPSSASIIDITKTPYFADNTGNEDVTDIINQAMLDFNDAHAIIYLPEGTYRVTNTVKWGSPPDCDLAPTYTCHRYVILAGAGIDKTTIKLDNNAPLFQDSSNPNIVVWSLTSAAMSFENSVRNLTINTGTGNPGTFALGFEANNQGGITNVKIISPDGQGEVGLHMGIGDQAGPCLIKNLEIEGFKIGIYTFGNQNSIDFENIELLNQTEYGIFNRQQMITIKDLKSTNEIPAIFNHPDGGSMVSLINSELIGIGNAINEVAFSNNNLRKVFLRNVDVSGYGHALQQLQNGFSLELVDAGLIEEYTTFKPERNCDNIERSLKLPIKERPIIIYEDTASWVSITDFGAEIDDGFQDQGSDQDDTQAIQDAFNSGSSTILIPGPGGTFPSRFIAFDTITIPPTVKHIIGAKGVINSNFTFEILPGNDTLIIEDFAKISNLNHFSNRVLILKNMALGKYSSLDGGGSGDVFIEDVVGGPYHFQKQNVWARQMDVENDSVNILNDGGTLWVFGLKTEKKGTAIKTINGGKSEVLGGLFYGTKVDEIIPKPIFEVIESSFSISAFKELGYINDAWDIKVKEIRNGLTKEYTIGNEPIRIGLFVAYPSDGNNIEPTVNAGPDQIFTLPTNSTTLSGITNDDALPLGNCYSTNSWTQIAGPSSLIIEEFDNLNTTISFNESGKYDLVLEADDGILQALDTVSIYVYDHKISTFDHNEDGVASGNGADANLRGWANAQKNYGGTSSFGPRNYFEFPAKSIIRIDIEAYDIDSIELARLEFELATTNTGIIEHWTYNIFGVIDGDQGEEWVEGDLEGEETTLGYITYENAIGFSSSHGGVYDPSISGSGGVDHSKTLFLGSIITREGIREKVSLSSEALLQFIKNDTSGSITFLITRESEDLNTIVFATKENTDFSPPTLYFGNKELVPIIENSGDFQFDFSCYPNPTSTRSINVICNNQQNNLISVNVKDINGNTLIHQKNKLDIGLQEFSINITSLVPGIYFLQIQNGIKTGIQKLIVI